MSGLPAHDWRRVRVARLIARMNVGGPAQQIARLMEGLDPHRYDQRLFCGDVEEGEADFIDLRAPGLPHHRISGLRRSVGPQRDLVALHALTREFRKFRPHIVHTHTAKAGILGRIAADMARVPLKVHTFHGHLLNSYWGPRATAAVIALERGLAYRTDLLMAVGSQVRDDLLAAGVGSANQYQVVPPGVAISDPPARGQARSSLGLALDIPVLAFVGRLVEVKRPDRLVSMMRSIRSRLPQVVLLVAGEGPLLEATRSAAEGLGDAVRFLGWRSDVETVYAAADVAVLTSDNEGMPVGLIEAALCSVPSVTTDVGSAREVVLDGVTGRVVGCDVEQLADALIDLLTRGDLAIRYGRAARRHAQNTFAAPRLVRDVDERYRVLLMSKGLLRVDAGGS